jgi:hypothetical protein
MLGALQNLPAESVLLQQAVKELKEELAWELNTSLTHHTRELFFRVGCENLFDQAKAKNPGKEVAELILHLWNKEGKEGLHRFYSLLKKKNEKVSLSLIDNSPAAVLFTSSDNQTAKAASESGLAGTAPSRKRTREIDEDDSDVESRPNKRPKSSKVSRKGRKLNRAQLDDLLEFLNKRDLVDMYEHIYNESAGNGTKGDLSWWIDDHITTLDELEDVLSAVKLRSLLEYVEAIEEEPYNLDKEEAIEWVVWYCMIH